MSWPERIVQDHKRRTDCAIHRVYAQLALEPRVLEKFDKLLHCVRRRAARLLEAPVIDGRHAGVDALVHLSRCGGAHIREAMDWGGASSSWRVAVCSLAHHLICEYRVPMFLSSCWYATDPAGDRKRGWFVAHSRGASFRSLNLPIAMTRKMEHIFLASQEHLPIEYAFRRAELLALGAPAECAKAILQTRAATDLRHGEFWRTVWVFLIVNADEIDTTQIGPMIDYIQAVRHERVKIETRDGIVEADPLQPTFSMKGRTVQSMMRLMQAWHRSLGSGNATVSWLPSPLQPLLLEEPRRDSSEEVRRWQMMELTNSSQLRSEGAALHHCVASYVDRCCRGSSSIWSLRLWQGEKVNHVLTVEVDPRKRAIVQARGRANRAASGKSLKLLQDWAARERLQMVI